jgi:predicted phage-related endonuclease
VNVQVQHQLAIAELEWSVPTALIGGYKFTLVWGTVERDNDLIADLMQKELAFVEMVNTRTPPEIDGSDESREVLEAMHPESNGRSIELPEHLVEIDELIVRDRQALANIELQLALWENQIREAIGPATFGQLPNGDYWSYRTGKDGKRRLKRKDRRQR